MAQIKLHGRKAYIIQYFNKLPGIIIMELCGVDRKKRIRKRKDNRMEEVKKKATELFGKGIK